jgi:WD40 repeat protein
VPRSFLDTPNAFWSPDERRVVVETEARDAIRVLDAQTGRTLRVLRSVLYLGRRPLSPDGGRIVLGGEHGAVVVDVATGARRRIGPADGMDRPSWSPDGSRIAGQTARGVAVVDVASGRANTLSVTSALEVSWSPDSRLLATYGAAPRGEASMVTVVDPSTGRVLVRRNFAEGEERGELAWSPDGARLAYQVGTPI